MKRLCFSKIIFDFVAIGDTTIHNFIRIKEASVNCDINKENRQICFDFANKVPYESVTIVPGCGQQRQCRRRRREAWFEISLCRQCSRTKTAKIALTLSRLTMFTRNS